MGKASTTILTKTVIDEAQPRDDRYDIWDGRLAGFGLRVEKSGRKTFIIRYRAEGGGRNAPRRFMTVGRFGTLTVDDARKKARQLLAAATVGDDPAGDRQTKRREMRMDALIELYEEEGCFIQRGKRQGMPMKPLTKQYTVARLKHHVVPLLGHKRVSEVGTGEIERFFRDVSAGKTACDEKIGPRKRIVVRGGDGAARKVFRDLSAVFSFACRREIVESNPCEKAVVQKTDNRRDRFLTLAEVTQLGRACDDLEAEGVNAKALNITRLWALTGCRRDEIAALKWTEVDLERGLLILDDTKTGKSLRPLALAAVALLRGLERSKSSDYVFPSDRTEDAHFQGTKKVWPDIIKKAKLPGVTPHTLRHTMGATATSTGEALALTGAILGHANMRSTMIYAHVENDPARKAANRVARKIAAALAGTDSKAKVAKGKVANNNVAVKANSAST
ncbi:site-specific integrase [Sphingomonas sp. MAHUQ-71]|uniref:Site-specific integrase n=1 Tax=Sphingomonas oryzagri TaxID=3042314 RepID=A0ABT6N592_9SPHN|nr:site-specific integrase [Sphingomonas oryzagri]